ncbi:MAG TPA: Rne/Rng family ribonuclease [Caulobacteraceae bacterium]
MLIDAAHAEETRVVVLDGNRVEEFDFESRARKQLRGNIYLAKVARVEPSLQAAFVEYGGNRHGFLAFNEIHPDYYQIPHADREALLREAEEDEEDHAAAPSLAEPGDDDAEQLGGLDDDDEVDEEVARRRQRLMRRYKIQEVIKRRQIMLVQVVKEERGNKGAALTTYLSLAGRYCVLMPNTDRGGGISRKISNLVDRKRLRSIVSDLSVPQGMGLIVRTAGAKRTKAEIKRDYEYLSRAWGNIRDTTLHSIAPAAIYEEEDLVKRAIRDLYDKDLEGIWVEGEAGYREARDFMRMLMPSQAKKVQPYRGAAPLFVHHKIEDHLAQIYSPTAPLRSGGYLVINQTEALVAVDVNSGRATRERNIEATALKTNMEAAEETARQLRLRDLAGLIVIDFIDMDEAKNNRAVEKKLKDCLKDDRARIQMGKISSFGLMEMSRQRRRTGILEGTTHVCPHCNGAGRVRSVESSSLAALRAIEMEALKGGGEIVVRVPRDVSLYILNHKREYLTRILHSHGLFVSVVIDEALAHADHGIDRISNVPHEVDRTWEAPAAELYADEDFADEDAADEDDPEDEDFLGEAEFNPDDQVAQGAAHPAGDDEAQHRRGRRRRRGRRGEEPRPASQAAGAQMNGTAPQIEREADGDAGGKRRRRGRRGGRRTREDVRPVDAYGWAWPARLSGDDPYEWRGASQAAVSPAVEAGAGETTVIASEPRPVAAEAEPVVVAVESEDIWVELSIAAQKPRRSRRSGARSGAAEAQAEAVATETVDPVDVHGPVPFEAAPSAAVAVETVLAAAPTPAPKQSPSRAETATADPAEISAPAAAPRRGWWRRGG